MGMVLALANGAAATSAHIGGIYGTNKLPHFIEVGITGGGLLQSFQASLRAGLQREKQATADPSLRSG